MGLQRVGHYSHTHTHTQSVFQALPDLLLGRKTHGKFSHSLSGAPAWKARNAAAVVDGLGWGSEAVNGHFRHLCQDSWLVGPPRTAPGPESLPGWGSDTSHSCCCISCRVRPRGTVFAIGHSR